MAWFSRTPQELVGGGSWRAPGQPDSQQGCWEHSFGVAVALSTRGLKASKTRAPSPLVLVPTLGPFQSQHFILEQTPQILATICSLCFHTKGRESFLLCWEALSEGDPVLVSLPQQRMDLSCHVRGKDLHTQ